MSLHTLGGLALPPLLRTVLLRDWLAEGCLTVGCTYFFTVIGYAWNYCHFALRIEPHRTITGLPLLDTALWYVMRSKAVFSLPAVVYNLRDVRLLVRRVFCIHVSKEFFAYKGGMVIYLYGRTRELRCVYVGRVFVRYYVGVYADCQELF